MDAELNTPDGDKLDILATLVESYEAKQFPIAAIKFRMEQQGLSLRYQVEKLEGVESII